MNPMPTVMFNGEEERFSAYRETQRRLKVKGLPSTLLHAALELQGVTDASL